MVDAIKPILSSLIIGPLSIPASTAFASTAPLEKTVPARSGLKSPTLRKMRFDYAYQPNLIALGQAETPMGKFVGELQEKWQFPSDHLPIGMTMDGLNIASWNILNSEYMGWVEKNTQGLSRSQITQEHIYLEGSKLTFRDLHVIKCIQSMLAHPSYPRNVISLQECSEAFIAELQKQLPEEYGIILSSDVPIKDQNIAIYDKRVLDFNSSYSQIAHGVFSKDERSVMNLCFIRKDTGETVRIINAHLPGEPGNPAPAEFAAYVASWSSPEEVTIAMGDMNFNEVEMHAAFTKKIPTGPQFEMIAPYCTNIGLDFCSKSIDHFFVFAQNKHILLSDNPDDVMPGLSEMVDLLEPTFSLTTA
jgi:hypothetical protein